MLAVELGLLIYNCCVLIFPATSNFWVGVFIPRPTEPLLKAISTPLLDHWLERKLLIEVVLVFIKPNKLVDVEFKFVIWVVWPFINPNNDDDVELILFIDVLILFMDVLLLLILVLRVLYNLNDH